MGVALRGAAIGLSHGHRQVRGRSKGAGTSVKPNSFNKEFSAVLLSDRSCEFLTHMGQPMLYDGDLYVLRIPHKDLTPTQYYRWVKGVRVA